MRCVPALRWASDNSLGPGHDIESEHFEFIETILVEILSNTFQCRVNDKALAQSPLTLLCFFLFIGNSSTHSGVNINTASFRDIIMIYREKVERGKEGKRCRGTCRIMEE